MPIRGPRVGSNPTLTRAAQQSPLGELVFGAATLFEAIQAKEDRATAQRKHEHDQAGDLASIRAKNQYRDWLTELQTREDYYQLGSDDLLEMQNRKIAELVGGMGQWEDKAAQLDLDLSVIASRPVATRREREHKDRQAAIFAELKTAESHALERYGEYAKAFARAGPEESEVLYQEWQVALDDVRTTRELAVGMGGWTPEARAELETELDGATRMMMRDAFRERAVLNGTVGDLYGRVANATDTLGPEGQRIFEGDAPDAIADMRATDSRRMAARLARLEAEADAARADKEAGWKAEYERAFTVSRNSATPLESAMAQAEILGRNGNPYADKLEKDAVAREERKDAARNLQLADDDRANMRKWELINRVNLGDEDEVADVERIAGLSGPEGNWSMNPDQVAHIDRVIEIRRNRLEQMSDAEREASRKWGKEVRPILARFHNFLAETQPVYAKGAEAQMGVRTGQLAARLEENMLLGNVDDNDRANHAALLEHMLYAQFGGGEYEGPEAIEQNMQQLDNVLYALYDSGEAPPNEVALARMALPPHLAGIMAVTEDGERIRDTDEQIEELTWKLGSRHEAELAAGRIIAWQQLDRKLRAGARPGQIRNERADAIKAIRYMPTAPAALADASAIDAVRSQ